MTAQTKSSTDKDTKKTRDAIDAGVDLLTFGLQAFVQVQQSTLDFAAKQHDQVLASTRGLLDRYEQVATRTTTTFHDLVAAQNERGQQLLDRMVASVR